MGVFTSKEAELCAYMEHNGWSQYDINAAANIRNHKFNSEEAAQIMLVARRTGQKYDQAIFAALTHRATVALAKFKRTTKGYR